MLCVPDIQIELIGEPYEWDGKFNQVSIRHRKSVC